MYDFFPIYTVCINVTETIPLKLIIFYCIFSGPRLLKNYVRDSPEHGNKKNAMADFYIAETDVADTESEDGDTTVSYSQKVTTKPQCKFKFRSFQKNDEGNSDKNIHLESSQELLQDLNNSPIVISSDEELEDSMLNMDY